MSDYISKSEMIYKIRGVVPSSQDVDFIVRLIKEQPTLDEKEIIRKPFEGVAERLEEKLSDTIFEKATQECNESYVDGLSMGYAEAIGICKEEGEIHEED